MSDGNFKWWYAEDRDAETWQGPNDSREKAISEGQGEYVGAAFWICEADKMSLDYSGIFDGYCDEDLSAEEYTLDLDHVYELFEEQNYDLWGEDGDEYIEASPEAEDELMEALRAAQALPEGRMDAMSKAFEDWCDARPDVLPTAWTFGTTRNHEEIPASATGAENAQVGEAG